MPARARLRSARASSGNVQKAAGRKVARPRGPAGCCAQRAPRGQTTLLATVPGQLCTTPAGTARRSNHWLPCRP
eukprot:3705946-Lingulodinium_polyedra.AAC.1